MTIAVIKTKAETALAEEFEAVASQLPGGADVLEKRRAAFGRFVSMGLPHRRIEEWKYTDLRGLMKDALPLSVADTADAATIPDLIVALGPLAHVDADRVVFVDGYYAEGLSSITSSDAVSVSILSDALADASGNTLTALMAAQGDDRAATVALNTATMTDGAFVQVEPGVKAEKPLMIVFLRAGKTARMTSVRNVLSVGDGAEANIIEVHVVVPGAVAEGQINALSEVTVGKDAKLFHALYTNGAGKAVQLANWNVSLLEAADYAGFQFTASEALVRNEARVTYMGEGGKFDLSGAFLGRGTEHIDTTFVIDHAVPHCESRELFKGVLDNRARGVFQGKVIVRPDAQKTDGKQMAQALMLSPDTEFDSKPELEIYADDVVCGHGTTTAEIDQDLLFYCKSRGIPDAEARALLIDSFIGEAIDKIAHEELRTAIASAAGDWLRETVGSGGPA